MRNSAATWHRRCGKQAISLDTTPDLPCPLQQSFPRRPKKKEGVGGGRREASGICAKNSLATAMDSMDMLVTLDLLQTVIRTHTQIHTHTTGARHQQNCLFGCPCSLINNVALFGLQVDRLRKSCSTVQFFDPLGRFRSVPRQGPTRSCGAALHQ